jgi:ribonuclease J
VFDNVKHIQDRTPIKLGPYTITPYLVDHSAYDAYALLVEADGKRLFYSGDLRAHGRKGALFEKLLREPPENVDVLLMEGTTLGRPGTEEGFPTETDLEHRFVELFKHTPGMPLVWCSGQNIDRIVTVFRACKRSGRQLILDLYTAHVLQATGNEHIPQGGWDLIKVFVPLSQRIRVKQTQEFDLINAHRAWRMFPEELAGLASKSVMLFRPSMMRDVEAGCLTGSQLIFSMWSGYLRDERNQRLHDWLQRHEIPLVECHTSGHAAVKDLVKLRACFRHAPVVPIHTEQAQRFEKMFGNVLRVRDGAW